MNFFSPSDLLFTLFNCPICCVKLTHMDPIEGEYILASAWLSQREAPVTLQGWELSWYLDLQCKATAPLKVNFSTWLPLRSSIFSLCYGSEVVTTQLLFTTCRLLHDSMGFPSIHLHHCKQSLCKWLILKLFQFECVFCSPMGPWLTPLLYPSFYPLFTYSAYIDWHHTFNLV